jgi:hypothetical protein
MKRVFYNLNHGKIRFHDLHRVVKRCKGLQVEKIAQCAPKHIFLEFNNTAQALPPESFFLLFLAEHIAASSSTDSGFFFSDGWSYVLMTMFALTKGMRAPPCL